MGKTKKGKGGKGLGKGGVKRRRKLGKEAVFRQGPSRRLAYRAGVRRMEKYALQNSLITFADDFCKKILKDAVLYAQNCDRITINTHDMAYALQRNKQGFLGVRGAGLTKRKKVKPKSAAAKVSSVKKKPVKKKKTKKKAVKKSKRKTRVAKSATPQTPPGGDSSPSDSEGEGIPQEVESTADLAVEGSQEDLVLDEDLKNMTIKKIRSELKTFGVTRGVAKKQMGNRKGPYQQLLQQTRNAAAAAATTAAAATAAALDEMNLGEDLVDLDDDISGKMTIGAMISELETYGESVTKEQMGNRKGPYQQLLQQTRNAAAAQSLVDDRVESDEE